MEDFVTYEQAYQLKQLGFDWKCNHIYKNKEHTFFHCLQDAYDNHNAFTKKISDNLVVSAPTLAQTRKWIYEIYKVSIEPHSSRRCSEWWVDVNFINDPDCTTGVGIFNSYEEALSEGLNYALYMILKTTNITKKRDKRVLRSKYKHKNENRTF